MVSVVAEDTGRDLGPLELHPVLVVPGVALAWSVPLDQKIERADQRVAAMVAQVAERADQN